MKYIHKVKHPDLSLIISKQKMAIVTDIKLRDNKINFMELMDDGIDEEKCKKMGVDSSRLVSKKGYIYSGINVGTTRSINKFDFYNKRNEFLQYEEWNENTKYIPILKVKKIPELNYIKKYGEPEYIDGFIWKSSDEFEKDVMGREIHKYEEFNTGIMTRLKDNTSVLSFLCMYPIDINPYWGCSHGCLYCYVKSVCGYYGLYTEKGIPSNFEQIKKQFYDGLHTNKDNLLSNLIRKRYPVQIGVNTDPFQSCEEEFKITKKILNLLVTEDYCFGMITKNPTLACKPEYLKLMSESNVLLNVSIPFYDNKVASKIEPNIPLPKDRIKAVKKLADNGVHVTIRVAPVMLGLNCNIDGSISPKHEYDKFFEELHEAGAKVVKTSEFRRSLRTDKSIYDVFGLDYNKIHRISWEQYVGWYVSKGFANPITYVRYCKQIRPLADKHKLTLATHCFDKRVDSATVGCCPTDGFPEEKLKKLKRHGVSVVTLYQLVKQKGRIDLKDIKENFNIENWDAVVKKWRAGFWAKRIFNMNQNGDVATIDEDTSMSETFYEYFEGLKTKQKK